MNDYNGTHCLAGLPYTSDFQLPTSVCHARFNEKTGTTGAEPFEEESEKHSAELSCPRTWAERRTKMDCVLHALSKWLMVVMVPFTLSVPQELRSKLFSILYTFRWRSKRINLCI